MLLEISIHSLISIGKILYVSPRPIDLSSFDLPRYILILAEVSVFDIFMITKKECAEIESQVSILRIT